MRARRLPWLDSLEDLIRRLPLDLIFNHIVAFQDETKLMLNCHLLGCADIHNHATSDELTIIFTGISDYIQ